MLPKSCVRHGTDTIQLYGPPWTFHIHRTLTFVSTFRCAYESTRRSSSKNNRSSKFISCPTCSKDVPKDSVYLWGVAYAQAEMTSSWLSRHLSATRYGRLTFIRYVCRIDLHKIRPTVLCGMPSCNMQCWFVAGHYTSDEYRQNVANMLNFTRACWKSCKIQIPSRGQDYIDVIFLSVRIFITRYIYLGKIETCLNNWPRQSWINLFLPS